MRKGAWDLIDVGIILVMWFAAPWVLFICAKYVYWVWNVIF